MLSIYLCNCNAIKIAHHSEILIRAIHLKGSNIENKASARGVMVIVVRNGHGDTSSNPERD